MLLIMHELYIKFSPIHMKLHDTESLNYDYILFLGTISMLVRVLLSGYFLLVNQSPSKFRATRI